MRYFITVIELYINCEQPKQKQTHKRTNKNNLQWYYEEIPPDFTVEINVTIFIVIPLAHNYKQNKLDLLV
jgi:hypothetical protein